MANTFGIFFNAIALFWILPFAITIVFPAIIPVLVSWIMNRKKKAVPSVGWLVLFLVLGGLIAYIFWIFCIRNVLYHEWDPGFEAPYSFFGREPITLNGNGSWIAKGWKEWHLDLIWTVLTLSVYSVAGLFAWYKNKKSPQIKEYKKTLFISGVALILVTMVLPKFHVLNFPWITTSYLTDTTNFQEKNIPCSKSTAKQPRILYFYNSENGEVVTDLDGKNQNVAFEKDVQLRGRLSIFSPDETKVVSLFDSSNYWIMCTYSHGATKIPIPEFKQNHYIAPRSSPSWSPDGEKLVVNLYGDVAIINIATKEFEIVKNHVAFRDNHVDLTRKDRNMKIPAYEVGTAYWSRDGLIYYSSFENDKNLLHQYNLVVLTDKVIYTTTEQMSILSGDPTGRYLLINLFRVNDDRSSYNFGRNIIFDVQKNKEVEQYDGDSRPNVVWSPSGKYFVQSNGKWYKKDGKTIVSATYVSTMDHSHGVNISALVEKYLVKEGKLFTQGSLEVKAIDFVDEDQLLVQVTFPDTVYNYHYALANLIVNFQSQEVKLLQDYPHGQDTGKKLFPIKILHP